MPARRQRLRGLAAAGSECQRGDVAPVLDRSRRRFLGWAGLGTLGLAAAIGAVRSTGYELHPETLARLRVLSAWQYVVMHAIGRRMLEPETADVAAFADEYLSGLPELERTELVKLIAFIEHVAPLWHGHLRRFTDLDDDEQDAVLETLEHSAIAQLRAGFAAIKAMSMMAYYRLPRAWEAIGYRGPVSPRSLK